MSIIYRKSKNIIDFMDCSKSQLNVSYKYWPIKLLSCGHMVEKYQFALGDTVHTDFRKLRTNYSTSI